MIRARRPTVYNTRPQSPRPTEMRAVYPIHRENTIQWPNVCQFGAQPEPITSSELLSLPGKLLHQSSVTSLVSHSKSFEDLRNATRSLSYQPFNTTNLESRSELASQHLWRVVRRAYPNYKSEPLTEFGLVEIILGIYEYGTDTSWTPISKVCPEAVEASQPCFM